MKKRVLAATAAVCLVLGGCHYDPAPQPTSSVAPSAAPSAAPAAREEFVLPTDPAGGWDPYAGGKGGNMTLLPLVCESLFTLDGTFTPQPLLAQGGTASEDGLSWTVTLRGGISFSNGEALTAKRVADAVNAARGDKSAYAGRLAGVKKVSAQDDGTVLFQLASPNAGFLALLDFPIALVSGEEVFGTGPYVLGAGTLTARSDWWRGLSLPLRSIPLKEVGSADALVAAFNAGTVSLAAIDPTGPDAPGYAGSYQNWEYPTSSMLYLGFQCARGPGKSAQFRRAVSMALDRGALADALLGHAWPAALPVHPNAARYDRAAAEQVGYDALAAAESLEELGYTLGDDGVRVKGRQPLALKLLVNADNTHKVALAQAAAGQLTGMGIKAEVRALAWEEYKKALGKGDFDLYLGEFRMTGDLDPGALLTPGSALYYGGFRSGAVSEALAAARATGEWRAFYEAWAQEAPQAVLCFKSAAMLTRWGQVEGATPTQGNLFSGFESWQIG